MPRLKSRRQYASFLLSISIAVKETDYGRNNSKDIIKTVINSIADDEMHRMIELKLLTSGYSIKQSLFHAGSQCGDY